MAGRLDHSTNDGNRVIASLFRQASLREDYLNQVQRDFLSLSFSAKTPLADVAAKFKFAITV